MSLEAQRLALLKLIEANPGFTQRELAHAMGISLGKANYCLKALIEKGLIKFGNFVRSNEKRAYAYLLTPSGIEEKTRIVLGFLAQKEAEFETIQQEIRSLRRELSGEQQTIIEDGR